MEHEPRGVLAAFDELLKNPSAGVQRLISGGGTLRPALALLVGALACYMLYGAASGFFQGGGQVLLAALKTPLVVLFSVALCLPSLYILSALMGAEINAKRLLVIVASFAGTLGIFMAGLLPITWLFSVSSRSLPFMVWMHLFLWGVTVILAGRCLQLLLRGIGARSFIAPWVILFILVSFQSATLFRPLIWQPPNAARFPGFTEKMSFFEHFGRSMDTPAAALEPEAGAADIDALVGAEHAFARAATEKGLREASRDVLAPDAIGFRPTLGSALDQLRTQPTPANPRAITRTWTPRIGEISQAGDLGWTTGPYTLAATDAPPQHGVYLSIWKKQPDGSWRVVTELATPTPEPVTFADDFFARLPRASGRYTRRTPEDSRAELLEMDRTFAATAKNMPLPNVFAQFLDSETRLYRPNVAPLVGRDAIQTYLSAQPSQVSFRPIDAAAASSADLGYTFGRYETLPNASGTAAPGGSGDSGYYLRVWSRWASGVWTIVADVTTVDARR